MSRVLTDSQNFHNIADAIREQLNDETLKMTPLQMPDKIMEIPTGSELIPLSRSEVVFGSKVLLDINKANISVVGAKYDLVPHLNNGGKAVINTGINVGTGYNIEMEVSFNAFSGNNLIGSGNGSNMYICGIDTGNSNKWTLWYGSGQNSNVIPDTQDWYTVQYKTSVGSQKLIINGDIVKETTSTLDFMTNRYAYVYSWQNESSAIGGIINANIRYVKVYDTENNLVLHLIPYESGNRIGMRDLISGDIKLNINSTGKFNVGYDERLQARVGATLNFVSSEVDLSNCTFVWESNHNGVWEEVSTNRTYIPQSTDKMVRCNITSLDDYFGTKVFGIIYVV